MTANGVADIRTHHDYLTCSLPGGIVWLVTHAIFALAHGIHRLTVLKSLAEWKVVQMHLRIGSAKFYHLLLYDAEGW